MHNDVRELRTAAGLSQQQLGDALDVSRQTINSIEKERQWSAWKISSTVVRKKRAIAIASGSDGV